MQAQSDNLTKFLATWGAVVATFGFGWTIYRDVVDRGSLKLTAKLRKIGFSTTGQPFFADPDLPLQASHELYLTMTVVNVGRRPIRWQGWGGKYHMPQNDRNAFFVVGRELPKLLQEGEAHAEWQLFTQHTIATLQNTRRLYVWDTRGKEWSLSRKQLRG